MPEYASRRLITRNNASTASPVLPRISSDVRSDKPFAITASPSLRRDPATSSCSSYYGARRGPSSPGGKPPTGKSRKGRPVGLYVAVYIFVNNARIEISNILLSRVPLSLPRLPSI